MGGGERWIKNVQLENEKTVRMCLWTIQVFRFDPAFINSNKTDSIPLKNLGLESSSCIVSTDSRDCTPSPYSSFDIPWIPRHTTKERRGRKIGETIPVNMAQVTSLWEEDSKVAWASPSTGQIEQCQYIGDWMSLYNTNGRRNQSGLKESMKACTKRIRIETESRDPILHFWNGDLFGLFQICKRSTSIAMDSQKLRCVAEERQCLTGRHEESKL